MGDYDWVVTLTGQAEIAAATVGSPVVLTDFSVGDGNGSYPTFTESDVALVNELIRLPLDAKYTDEENYPGQAIINGLIPADHSASYSLAFTIREAAIWSSTGDMFAVARRPATLKPIQTDGTFAQYGITTALQVSDVGIISTTADPDVITASKEYVDRYTQVVKVEALMPTTLNGYVEVLQVVAGALACTVKITKDDGDAEGAKIYHMVFNENTTVEDTWCRVIPFLCSGVTNDNNWGLDVKWDKDTNGAKFRVRLDAVDGVTPPSGNFQFELSYAGYGTTVTAINYLSATGTDATVTDFSGSSSLNQANGKVGINVECPTHTLEVDGEGTITGAWRYGNELYNIAIGTGPGFIASMADYIAGSPAIGDRVIITESEEITSKMVIPEGIIVRQWKGVGFTCTSDLTTILEISDDVEIEEEFRLTTSHTGTVGCMVLVNGSDINANRLKLYNTSTGTVNVAVSIASSKNSNKAFVEASNSGAGSITSNLSDSSGTISNYVVVFNDQNEMERSLGVRTFSDGLSINNGGDQPGDMYYRDDNGYLQRFDPPTFPNQIIVSDENNRPTWVDREDVFMKYLPPIFSGVTTTEGTTNGRLIDANADFTTLGITAESHFVLVPGYSNQLIWQIDEVIDANTLQLRRSSHSLSTDTIYKNVVYTILKPLPGKEQWVETVNGDFPLATGAGNDATIDSNLRVILVECDITATTQAAADDLIFTYGSHSSETWADGPDITAGDRVWMLLLEDGTPLNIAKGTANITGQCKVYQLVE